MADRAFAPRAGEPAGRPPAARPLRGVLALQRNAGNRAVTSLLQRQPKTFEQEIIIGGIDYSAGRKTISSGVDDALVAAAQKRLAKGPIKDVKDLAELRAIALADDTISDAERLFLAALLDPANAERVKAINLKSQDGRDLKLKFTLDDATAKRIHDVADVGRPAAGRGKADAQIVALVGSGAKAQAILKFARDRKVPDEDLLEAMRMGASDSTQGDMRAAGAIYAIAAAAKHPLAGDIKAGRIKVDEMELGSTKRAAYQPTGSGRLRKGDTIYVPPSFDIGELLDRETAIHELEHARQDKAESGLVTKQGPELEPDAYVAGARYALEEIAALPDGSQAAAAKKLAGAWAPWDMLAAVAAANADTKRLLPIVKAINAARKKEQQLSDLDFSRSESDLKAMIGEQTKDGSGTTGLSGLSGESVFDVRRALAK
jgi:hypothetical protein